MENENKNNDIREIISKNIIKYRKSLGLTQLELAEKLNYSDKTLSKWERGESIPDVITLKQLADLFGISVEVLLCEENKYQEFKPQPKKKGLTQRTIISISLLSVAIVWLVATIAFVTLQILSINSEYIHPWISFVYAIPVSSIILLVYSCIWGNKFSQFFTTSLVLWTIALSIHLSVYLVVPKIALVYIIAIPLEVMAFLFFIIFKRRKK